MRSHVLWTQRVRVLSARRRGDPVRCRARAVLVVALLLVSAPALADVVLPPGFTAGVYVTGEGFGQGSGRDGRGIRSTATLAVDQAGLLYLARTGRRYLGGEVDDLATIYRIPVGGARLTPDTEARFFYGPPLWNPQVAAPAAGREIMVTTFDRDRKVGVLYRVLDGRAELFAGGTPPRGTPPLFRQPEGVAIDAAGNIYVADRDRGVVVKLDSAGHVLDPRYVSVSRPRVLAVDARDNLWVGSDGGAEAPWQRGPGEIRKVDPRGEASVVLRGPMPNAISLSPGGHLFVADRQAGKVFFLTPEGKAAEFATFTHSDAPRSLAFAPVTPGTRGAGIAGDLFLVTINRGAWPVNEVIRISGPFDELARERRAGAP